MTKQQLFVKHHFTSSIVLGLVVVLSISFGVIAEDTSLFKKSDGQVMGVSTVQSIDNQSNLVINYQNQVKNLVATYLQERSAYQSQNQDWLFLINTTKYKLMNLATPVEYQDLTLKLISLLEAEKQAVAQGSNSGIDVANKKWQEMLDQFYWLD